MSKILIAEDDHLVSTIIAEIVESLGHQTIRCRNGQRALETLEDNLDIALLITDIAMPVMDGKALIQPLRAENRWADLPILIVSGVVGPKEIADLLRVGATAFLPKPLKVNDLTAQINKCLPV